LDDGLFFTRGDLDTVVQGCRVETGVFPKAERGDDPSLDRPGELSLLIVERNEREGEAVLLVDDLLDQV
jgi:hypothetical protein